MKANSFPNKSPVRKQIHQGYYQIFYTNATLVMYN